MGKSRHISRLTFEQRIARAVGFTVTVNRNGSVFRKTANQVEEARQIALQMNAGLNAGDQEASISAITPEGKTFRVPYAVP